MPAYLAGELTHHLGYPPGGVKPEEANFEPRFLPKPQRPFTGFDDKILALFARV